MHRVVIDTSVVVAALRSRSGASNEVLRRLGSGKIIALATPALFLEYEEVLKRPEHCDAHGLSAEQIDRFLATLASALEPVSVHFSWRPQLRDPSDEMVLETAINGQAQYLVTFNVKDFMPTAEQFGISVKRPNEFLKEKAS